MSIIDVLLFVFIIALAVWNVSLRKAIRYLEQDLHSKPTPPPGISVRELKMLQKAMTELVQDVESFTNSQMKKMKVQTQSIQALAQRLEERMQEIEQPEPTPPPPPTTSTRVVPLAHKPIPANHKNREQIIELYRKGWSPDKIAEELRLPQGEVQLVVKFS